MKINAIIPARYTSSRFPGKPLVNIKGMSMIQRVYEQSKNCSRIDEVVVATDDSRIFDHVSSFGGKVVMTSSRHVSGTDRVAEAAEMVGGDLIVNIQGDEPCLNPLQIEELIHVFADADVQIATLIKPVVDRPTIIDPNRPKVVIDKAGFALYFSRSPIPYVRGVEESKWMSSVLFYSHVGMYGFRRNVLTEIVKLPQSPLEQAESLEQLRWLENGYKIKTAKTSFSSWSVDIPEDLNNLPL